MRFKRKRLRSGESSWQMMKAASYSHPQYVLNLPFMSQMEDKNHAKARWRSA
jgi:hypothetical protein